MKHRNIPFGYDFENGVPVIHASESHVVKKIYAQYLAGASL